MKFVFVLVMIFGGAFAQGERMKWEKKTVSCDLEVTRHGEVLEKSQGYGLKVRLTYQGPSQQMVTRWKTLELIVVTKEGKEIVLEPWGADGTRRPGLSDYHMLRYGDSAVFGIGVSTYQEEGKWALTWSDSFGNWYGCKLETLDGLELVMKYSNEATEDLKLMPSENSLLMVPREEIWSGTVKSKAVPLSNERIISDE